MLAHLEETSSVEAETRLSGGWLVNGMCIASWLQAILVGHLKFIFKTQQLNLKFCIAKYKRLGLSKSWDGSHDCHVTHLWPAL